MKFFLIAALAVAVAGCSVSNSTISPNIDIKISKPAKR